MRLVTTQQALELLGIGHKAFKALQIEPSKVDHSKQGRPSKLYDSVELFNAVVNLERAGSAQLYQDDEGQFIDVEAEKILFLRAQRIQQQMKNNEHDSNYAPVDYLKCCINQIKAIQTKHLLIAVDEVRQIEEVPEKVKQLYEDSIQNILSEIDRLKLDTSTIENYE